MRKCSKVFARGDAMDRQIGRVLNKLCSHEYFGRSYAEICRTPDRTSECEKQDKYKKALEIEMATYLPIVKLDTGKYLIGTSVR